MFITLQMRDRDKLKPHEEREDWPSTRRKRGFQED